MHKNKYSVLDNLVEGAQIIDNDFRYYYVNDAVCEQGKTTKESLIGCEMKERYPGIENTELYILISKCLKDRKPVNFINEFNFPDGSKGWFELRIQSVPEGILIFSVDVTKKMLDELSLIEINNELKRKVEQNDILIRELHHRVKNNLQLVISLINLYSTRIENPVVLEALDECRNYLRSLSMVHHSMYASNDFSNVNLTEYVEKLCNYFNDLSDNNRVKVVYNLEKVIVSIDCAITLGLIVNELITNSYKHAFPDNRKGSIKIDLKEVDGVVLFSIEDDGIGLPENIVKNHSESFGLELAETLVDQINGTINFHTNHGTKYQISFKKAKPRVLKSA